MGSDINQGNPSQVKCNVRLDRAKNQTQSGTRTLK